MAENHLQIEMEKDWRISASSWDSEFYLTEEQIEYAAMDAYVGVQLFKKFSENWWDEDNKKHEPIAN